MGSIPSISKLATGVPGLDRVLRGGLLAHRTYLVRGTYGTGKTTFGLQFLRAGLARGESVLYVTMSETWDDIVQNAAGFGWDLSDIHALDLTPDASFFVEAKGYDVFSPSEVERQPTASEIASAVERHKPARVVFDSVSQLRLLSQDKFHYRRQLIGLVDYFREHGATAILLSEFATDADPDSDAAFLSHGVITITRDLDSAGRQRRHLVVEKMRGSGFRTGQHEVQISDAGFTVHPRLIVEEQKREFDPGFISSGIPGLDQMLHGGLDKGTCTILSGHAGVGKTTLGMAFVKETAGRGGRSVVYTFEESKESILHRCRQLNIPADDMLKQGKLELVKINPIQLSADRFAEMVHREVTENNPTLVMIDSISGYFASLDSGQEGIQHLHNLVAYLGNQGVSTIITNELSNITGTLSPTENGASYLADSLVLMRYIEVKGRLLKTISVLKKRLTDHEEHLREIKITPYGITVGEPLQGLTGILTGVPELLKAVEEAP